MAGNISGLHVFANDVGPLPLKLLDDSFSTLSITLNTLATFSNFYQDQGTTNAYTIQTSQYQFVSYADGLQVTVRIANTNTGASTLNVNGLGAMPILTSIGTELQPNALVAGSIVTFVYNAQRQAWQIASGGAGGGQITAPLHVTNPTGQSALAINVDGSGYLGDFNGNGLSWDGACNFTFEGGATLSGITPDFRINTVVPASAGEPQLELRADGYSGITAWPSGTALNLEANGGGALGTPPNQLEWDSNGNWLFGGTSSITGLTSITSGSAAFGTAPNQILIDSNGNITTTGTAMLPGGKVGNLSDVTLTNPQNGQALVYDSATQTWINATPVTTLEGLSNVYITGAMPGQVLTYSINPFPGWVNSTIPGLGFLNSLSIVNPTAGQVLTWDGAGWVAANPGQVAQFPLTSLTDVNIQNPLNRQVLTWDAPTSHWINAAAPQPALATLSDVSVTAQQQGQVLSWNGTLNRWVNTALPGGSVIALSSLMDTNISDPQDNQVLTWNYAQSRWVNHVLPTGVTTLAGLTDVTLTNATATQVLTYNGTHWVNGGSVSITGNTGTALYITNPNASQWGEVILASQSNAQGLWINAGDTSADYSLLVRNRTNTTFLQLTGDGAGFIGPNSVNNMWWNPNGSYSINAAAAGSTLNVYGTSGTGTLIARIAGAVNNPGLFVTNFEATAKTLLAFSGTSTPNGAIAIGNTEVMTFSPTRNVGILAPVSGPALTVNGAANAWGGLVIAPNMGLAVQAGQSPADLTFYVNNAPANNVMMVIYGDAHGFMGANPTNCLSWNTSGAFTVGPPYGSNAALTVEGSTGTNYALRVNNPGTAYAIYVGPTGSQYGIAISVPPTNAPTQWPLNIGTTSGVGFFGVRGDGGIMTPMIQPLAVSPNIYGSQTTPLYYTTSAIRFKREVHSVQRSHARELVARLRGITFKSKCKGDNPNQTLYGFVAEEVAAIDAGLVTYDGEGRPMTVQYDRIATLLLPLMRELLGMDEPEGELYG